MDKVCPVVIRGDGRILAFRHPLAGLQFVKGTLEEEESTPEAATRELHEEAGVVLSAVHYLGESSTIVDDETWHFWLMQDSDLPETWDHACEDDGGHVFSFFWQDLTQPLPQEFAAPFQRAAEHLREVLT
ncbi:NUDIX hydrolase [Gymnodinialimonas hymeniacidonis]|uniref:NUDIX hydrolase n=1 Tax=Gymnodinialimonas hymeniacidonis TaxID=3126508 RepID=UPI0034C6A961